MPASQQQPKPFDAERAKRFVALWAGFDTGNPNDAEATGKGKAMRRMADESGLRIVDVLELPEVRKAFDVQMQPVRDKTPGLQEAMEQAAAYREEATELMRKVRDLAEELAREQQNLATYRERVEQKRSEQIRLSEIEMEKLRGELAAMRGTSGYRQGPAPSPRSGGAVAPSLGAQSWVFEVAAVLIASVLLIMWYVTELFEKGVRQ